MMCPVRTPFPQLSDGSASEQTLCAASSHPEVLVNRKRRTNVPDRRCTMACPCAASPQIVGAALNGRPLAMPPLARFPLAPKKSPRHSKKSVQGFRKSLSSSKKSFRVPLKSSRSTDKSRRGSDKSRQGSDKSRQGSDKSRRCPEKSARGEQKRAGYAPSFPDARRTSSPRRRSYRRRSEIANARPRPRLYIRITPGRHSPTGAL